ncbi:MAG TPA: hypothetical protein VII45_03495 [Solirubrobacterales bacterium]
MSSNPSIIVVANRTADSPELIEALRRRSALSPVRFTLLVPAVPYGFAWAANMKAGGPGAVTRAQAGARRMRGSGLELERTIVGDPDPVSAVGDALHTGRYDEVIVSTVPRGIAHWFRLSLPDRLRRLTDLPVSHVAGHAGPPASA